MISLLLTSVLAFASLPPTTTKGQSEASKSTTFNFEAPFNQFTKTASTTALVETGNTNLLKNPGFEAPTAIGFTASGGTATVTTTASQIGSGLRAGGWDSGAAAQTYCSDLVAVPKDYRGQNGRAQISLIVPSGTATHTLQVKFGSTVYNSITVNSSTSYQPSAVTFIYPTDAQIAVDSTLASGQVCLESVNANEPQVYFDNWKLGINDGIGQTAQASFVGSVEHPNANLCSWQTTSATYANFAADTDCGSAVANGSLSAPGTKIPGFVYNDMPSGNYLIIAQAPMYASIGAGQSCYFRLSDGTNSSNPVGTDANATSVTGILNQVVWNVSYSTNATRTIQIQAIRNAGSTTCGVDASNATTGDTLKFMVYRFPLASDLVFSTSLPSSPTVTRLTSGSSTYNTPRGVKYLRVKMVGGGGGGAGSSNNTTSNGGNGGNGGTTTFGTSLLSAAGGSAGTGGTNPAAGGAGGSPSINAPAVTVAALLGGEGSPGSVTAVQNASVTGGIGGASFFGGLGKNGQGNQVPGGNAVTNSGSGGGGAAALQSAASGQTNYGGGGGGAGAYIEALIYNPSASYAYAVGAAGSAGTAGTGGAAGGAGGSGYIEITEYYGTENMPLFKAGVIYSDTVRAEGVDGVTSIAEGTFTSSTIPGTNITSVSLSECMYSRSGKTVDMSCSITASCPVSSASSFTMTLPFMSANFSASNQVSGWMSSTSTENGIVRANSGATTATVEFNCQSGGGTRRLGLRYRIP